MSASPRVGRRVHEGDVALAFQLWREVVACTPARFHWLIALISVGERDAAAVGLAASGARRGIAKICERVDGCGGPLTAADCGWWQVFGDMP